MSSSLSPEERARRAEEALERELRRRQEVEEAARREVQVARQEAQEAARREVQAARREVQAQEAARREVQAARREVQAVRREADEAVERERRQTRPTTFEEFLHHCHESISLLRRVEPDPTRTTKGTITSVKDRPCPRFIKPWQGFSAEQQCRFEAVAEKCGEKRWLSSKHYLEELGGRLKRRIIGSEKDLELYHFFGVEDETAMIIEGLFQEPSLRQFFGLEGTILFASHANALSNNSEEVLERLLQLQLADPPPESADPQAKPKAADQICVYVTENDTRHLKLVLEYKAPHKLTTLHLRAGLARAMEGSLNLPEEVFGRITIPNDPQERFAYHSEQLVASALTQTYGYMLDCGLEYGVVVTGEAYVFLRIDEDDPHTLYFHLAEPTEEADSDPQWGFLLSRTAVGQLLSFLLAAVHSELRSQEWTAQALENAPTTTLSVNDVLEKMPREIKRSSPANSEYAPTPFKGPNYEVVRSPYMLRRRKTGERRGDPPPKKDTPPDTSDDSDEPSPSPSPAQQRRRGKAQSRTQPKSQSSRSGSQPGSQSGPLWRSRPPRPPKLDNLTYCSQACLRGLALGRPLDTSCPNVAAHRAWPGSTYHAISRTEVLQRLEAQLYKNRDDWCHPLGIQGARGALFRVTLASHGYTFAAKGTVRAFVTDLQHEEEVYGYLDKLQGTRIPVCVGSVRLSRPYYLDYQVHIIHMLILAWAGEEVTSRVVRKTGLDIDSEMAKANEELRQLGVEHRDVRPANVLWSPSGGLLVIDFERAQINRVQSRAGRWLARTHAHIWELLPFWGRYYDSFWHMCEWVQSSRWCKPVQLVQNWARSFGFGQPR